jgi:hypothetical protein
LNSIESVKQPKRRECEECIKIGSYWVHLRTCQTCGVTLCCDSSPNQHASKHAHATGHPAIASCATRRTLALLLSRRRARRLLTFPQLEISIDTRVRAPHTCTHQNKSSRRGSNKVPSEACTDLERGRVQPKTKETTPS